MEEKSGNHMRLDKIWPRDAVVAFVNEVQNLIQHWHLLKQIFVGAVSAVQPQVEGLGQRLLGPLRASPDWTAAKKCHL